jgi:hypothetical protein
MNKTASAMTPTAMKRGFIFWAVWLGSDIDFSPWFVYYLCIFDHTFFSADYMQRKIRRLHDLDMPK